MSKTLVANTNLATAPANSVKANTSGSISQPTDLVISTNQVLANNGTLQGLTLGTNQFVGNTGSGLAAVTLSAGSGIGLSTVSNTLNISQIPVSPITLVGSSYTLQTSDNNRSVCMDSAVANIVSIPSTITTPGFETVIMQINTGQTTISAGAGVTLRAPYGSKLFARYSAATVVYINPTVGWVLYGDVMT
jgi:hypothetical protein